MSGAIEIFGDEGLSNIFNGKLIPSSNPERPFEVIGYRLESVKRDNVRVITKSKTDSKGIYRATVYFDGVRRKGKSRSGLFFPDNWSKEDVINAVSNAYQNGNFVDLGNNYFTGQTSDGTKIILLLDGDRKIIDAMPWSDEIKRLRKKPKLCTQCGKHKQTICLDHNPYQKKQKTILKQIRYYFRKSYFNFARKLNLVE